MIPTAISKPAAVATAIDSTMAATALNGRDALLIGTIIPPNRNAYFAVTRKPRRRRYADGPY
jgi:hypothetical protein